MAGPFFFSTALLVSLCSLPSNLQSSPSIFLPEQFNPRHRQNKTIRLTRRTRLTAQHAFHRQVGPNSTPTEPIPFPGVATLCAAARLRRTRVSWKRAQGVGGRVAHSSSGTLHLRIAAQKQPQLTAHETDWRSKANNALPNSDICKIILAVIFPPLGVFLEVGCGGQLCLNIILTLCGTFLPVPPKTCPPPRCVHGNRVRNQCHEPLRSQSTKHKLTIPSPPNRLHPRHCPRPLHHL